MPIYRRELRTKSPDGKTKVSWHVYVYDKNVGQRRYLGAFPTKTQAKECLIREEERIRLGYRPTTRKDIVFSALVDEWMAVHVSTLRPSTQKDYANAGGYLKRYFRKTPSAAIERSDCMKLVPWLKKQGLGPRSVRKTVTRLTQIFNFAVEFGYLQASPIATPLKNLPSVPKKRIDPLTPDELRRLLAATPEYWQPLLLVMATAGLRYSEALGLTVRDVRLETGELHVRQQLCDGELVDLKTTNAVRMVPLAPSVVAELKAHMERRPQNELDLLFPTEQGRPVDRNNFRQRIWVPAVEAANLGRRVTIHDLRRTYGSMTARHGRSAAYLQATMGHSSARTSLTYYVGIYGDEQEQAVADVEKWLGSEASASYSGGLILCTDLPPDRRNTQEIGEHAA